MRVFVGRGGINLSAVCVVYSGILLMFVLVAAVVDNNKKKVCSFINEAKFTKHVGSLF